MSKNYIETSISVPQFLLLCHRQRRQLLNMLWMKWYVFYSGGQHASLLETRLYWGSGRKLREPCWNTEVSVSPFSFFTESLRVLLLWKFSGCSFSFLPFFLLSGSKANTDVQNSSTYILPHSFMIAEMIFFFMNCYAQQHFWLMHSRIVNAIFPLNRSL